MIDTELHVDWDEAPDAMNFELPFGAAIAECAALVRSLRQPVPDSGDRQTNAVRLYLLAPALINVTLNYRICVEFGLPLHPTEYIDFAATEKQLVRYSETQRRQAEALFDSSIKLARAACRLDQAFDTLTKDFLELLPAGLEQFVYTSKADRYTWRGAEPDKVRALARQVNKTCRPSLAVGAAHGSIMAGLLLAEYLDCPLWFLRFSMFKRRDTEPVVCPGDRYLLSTHAARGEVLVFDEDSASGTTLSILHRTLSPLLTYQGISRLKTGAVIRHVTTPFHPDYVGKTWWD